MRDELLFFTVTDFLFLPLVHGRVLECVFDSVRRYTFRRERKRL